MAGDKKEQQAEQKRLNVEAGWPKGWQPALVDSWKDAGGTVELSLQLTSAGWSVKDCKPLLSHIKSGRGIPADVLASPAAFHRQLGDDLLALCEESWPVAPEGTLLSVKRQLPAGERTRDTVVPDSTGGLIGQQAFRRNGKWSVNESTTTAATLEALFRAHPELLTFDEDVMAWVRVVDDAALDAVASALVLQGTEGSPERDDPRLEAWTDEDLVESWLDEDELLEEVVEAEVTHRWVMVNGDRVLGVKSGDVLMPVRYRVSDEEFVRIRHLAEGRWFSDGGGAPMSWEGGGEVALVAKNVVMERVWGDADSGISIRTVSSTADTALADVVVTWTLAHDYDVAAAIELEPLDPGGEVTPEQREDFQALLDSVDASYFVDAGLAQHVRSRLAQGSKLYAATADALLHPASPIGRRMLTALADVADSGLLVLTLGNWVDDKA